MPGLLPDHYGAPRHFSLPSIEEHNKQRKPTLTVGHCDKMNLFYIREPCGNVGRQPSHIALMRYRKVRENIVQIDGMHVPQAMRGRGVTSALAREALNHMVSENMWIDVRCPVTKHYVNNNQYANYVRQLIRPLKADRSKTAAS